MPTYEEIQKAISNLSPSERNYILSSICCKTITVYINRLSGEIIDPIEMTSTATIGEVFEKLCDQVECIPWHLFGNDKHGELLEHDTVLNTLGQRQITLYALEGPPAWRRVASFEKYIYEKMFIVMSANGQLYISYNFQKKTVELCDMTSSKRTMLLNYHEDTVNAAAISADGSLIAIGSDYLYLVRVGDMESKECVAVLEGHTDSVDAVAMLADGSRIASGSFDRTVRVWDSASSKCITVLRGHTKWVEAVAMSADGSRIASCSNDKTVRVWDMESKECVAVLEGHTLSVYAVAMSADGGRIASGSSDETVRVWDMESKECVAVLEGHTNSVKAVAISADGGCIASGSQDETVRVWDMASKECTEVITDSSFYGNVKGLEISLDGTRIICPLYTNGIKCLKLR